MREDISQKLLQLGFTPNEAQVYLALVQSGPLSASSIAAATGLARTVVYPTLDRLVDRGLVDAGQGYGSRFSAVPAEAALGHLLLERERITSEVIDWVSSLKEPEEAAPAELIQLIRSPRAIKERFDRLQLEAEQTIEVLCKPPFSASKGNPAEDTTLRRGIRNRAIYEQAALEHPSIKPYLLHWVEKGEDSRVFEGELPNKLAIFDSKTALVPLVTAQDQMGAVVIRHAQVVQMLTLGFEHLWERSIPLAKWLDQSNAGRQQVSPAGADRSARTPRRLAGPNSSRSFRR
jgi:sugar-specific transcriptional regulator TrmB